MTFLGILRINLSVDVERYMSPLQIETLLESSYVDAVCGPYEAKTREIALEIAKKEFEKL